jgi:hypothetical protein
MSSPLLRARANTAFQILKEAIPAVLEEKIPADSFLARKFKLNKQFGSRDRRFIRDIVFVWFRWRGLILEHLPEEPEPSPRGILCALLADGAPADLLEMWADWGGLAPETVFAAAEGDSGVSISTYQFARYCKAYDGIRDMLADNGAKLLFRWENRSVVLSAVPVADYTQSPIDGDIATLTVEQHKQKVNHLICLGKGELSAREVIHLYVDRWGNIGTTQHYTGLDEVTDTYDYSNAESSAELQKAGIKRLGELMNTDKADNSIMETEWLTYDIGDIVGASDSQSGVTVAAAVSQKIVKIQNGAIRTQYKTGG